MSTGAHCVYRAYRYRQMPIRATFVPYHRNMYLCMPGTQVILSMRPAPDPLSKGMARITNVIDASCPPAPIQIPIALRIILTTAQRPAVSSLEASPTPAH